jgi:biopolymer transport protein ExbB
MTAPQCFRASIGRSAAFLLALAAMPLAASAWWGDAYSQRTRITLNTTAAGVETRAAISGALVPLRLHSGNFDFVAAKPDGSDLRVVSADDKTPLKFVVERFDGTNELAVLWIEWPTVAPGTDKNEVYVYSGNAKAAAEPAAVVAGSGTAAAFRFAERDGSAADHTGTLKAQAPATVEPNGLIGPAARLAGTAIRWAAAPAVQAAAGAPYSVSMWVRPEGQGGTLFEQGPLVLAIDGDKPVLRFNGISVAGGSLPVNAWAQVALTLAAGKATLYVNGVAAGEAPLPAAAAAVSGPWSVGGGFTGLLDELQISTAARSAEFMRFAHAAQAADAKLVASVLQPKGAAEASDGAHGGYMGILVKNLTVDAWVVIALCGLLFLVAVWVMVDKFVLVRRVDSANQSFLQRFREARDVMQAEGLQQHPKSSLARLYEAGLRELKKRDVGSGDTRLSGASINAVKAAVDADVVRENNRLNSHMVWLTIAIAGGPFLGLLGTVLGVMITFAAIAAAGDVNVNAIAPGIAAALLATVAGLGVAIPALFGYNYLTSRMKTVSSDMLIFVDELVTRVAESYGER